MRCCARWARACAGLSSERPGSDSEALVANMLQEQEKGTDE
jgi:hypothetical protein